LFCLGDNSKKDKNNNDNILEKSLLIDQLFVDA
jgi:hypothetical protein